LVLAQMEAKVEPTPFTPMLLARAFKGEL